MYVQGFIPEAAKRVFDKKWSDCVEREISYGATLSWVTLEKCAILMDVLQASGFPNVYNIKTYVSYNEAFLGLEQFMNDPHLQTLIHARGNNLPGINCPLEKRNWHGEKSLDVNFKNEHLSNSQRGQKLVQLKYEFRCTIFHVSHAISACLVPSDLRRSGILCLG